MAVLQAELFQPDELCGHCPDDCFEPVVSKRLQRTVHVSCRTDLSGCFWVGGFDLLQQLFLTTFHVLVGGAINVPGCRCSAQVHLHVVWDKVLDTLARYVLREVGPASNRERVRRYGTRAQAAQASSHAQARVVVTHRTVAVTSSPCACQRCVSCSLNSCPSGHSSVSNFCEAASDCVTHVERAMRHCALTCGTGDRGATNFASRPSTRPTAGAPP